MIVLGDEPATIDLPHEAATTALGRAVAMALKPGDTVCLWGELGAGKSTLARGLVRALTSPEEDVPSPTFTLAQPYEGRDFAIVHFDLYRIADAREAYEIGVEEALEDGVAVIEWPERLGASLPTDRLDISLAVEGEGRRARLQAHGAWRNRSLDA